MRPMILPPAMKITVKLNPDSRSTATIYCDAKTNIEFNQNDLVEIGIGPYPLKWYVDTSEDDPWFLSLSRCLHWNSKARNE